MRLVGLTGGIGSGKSAVSARLAEHGARVVDADLLAREAVAPGTPGLAAVVAAFGEGVLRPDGALDRPALGRLVFGDDDARARLEQVVHPRVAAATRAAFDRAAQDGVEVVVHDVPLLLEAGLRHAYDEVVVVLADEAVRLDRLVRLRGLSEDEARARIAAQVSDDERRAAATVLLHNDGSLADLHVQVDELWERLTGSG